MNPEQYTISQQILKLQEQYDQLIAQSKDEDDLEKLQAMMLERNRLVTEVTALRMKLVETAS